MSRRGRGNALDDGRWCDPPTCAQVSELSRSISRYKLFWLVWSVSCNPRSAHVTNNPKGPWEKFRGAWSLPLEPMPYRPGCVSKSPHTGHPHDGPE
eukprot:3359008-Prymnesium_polylepis.1